MRTGQEGRGVGLCTGTMHGWSIARWTVFTAAERLQATAECLVEASRRDDQHGGFGVRGLIGVNGWPQS